MLERTRQHFVEAYGQAAATRRAAEIAALPAVLWREHELRTVRCHGDFGRGPHDMHLPERVLWSLIAIDMYRCAYHRP